MTRRYDASPGEVWLALTESDSRARWLGGLDAEPAEVEHERLLELRLADSLVRIELRAHGGGTMLVLDHVDMPAEKGMLAARLWTEALDRFEAGL